MLATVTAVPTVTDSDPITALLERDWAAVGGWSLFLGLCLFVVIGSFREWWVPGGRYRRLEQAAQKQSDTLTVTAQALEKQVTANEIVKHFFEETTPRRREVDDDEETYTTQPTRRSRRIGPANV